MQRMTHHLSGGRAVMPALLFGLELLLGCQAALAADTARYAFTVNSFDNSLASYRVDADGMLHFSAHWPVPAFPAAVAVHPSGRFVVTASKADQRIGVYRIDADNGELSPVPGSPSSSVGRSPFFVTFHPSGRFVYVASRFDGVLAFRFDLNSGALSPIKGMPYPAGERTRSLAMHPSGRFLYASNAYSNTVSGFAIDQATGQLTPLKGSPFAAGDTAPIDTELVPLVDYPPNAGGVPYYLAMHPTGQFLYVANWGGGSLSGFRIDEQTGTLSLLKGFPFITGINPYALAVNPSGRSLYVASWADSALWAYGIDPVNGDLTRLSGSPFAVAGFSPVAISFDPAGRHAYVPNYHSNNVSVFALDHKTGVPRLQDTVQTRSGPWSLALLPGTVMPPPTRRTAFALAGGQLILLRQQAGDGKLESVARIAAGTRPASVVARHDGRFVYVADAAGDHIYGFGVDGDKLQPIPGASVAAGKEPRDLALDINGHYLYAVNEGSDNLSVYAVDADSGGLSEVGGSPFHTGRDPVSVTLDAAARYALVANAGADSVSVFRYVNSLSPLVAEINKYGSPFSVGKPATGKHPLSLAEDPTGKHVYIANAEADTLSLFRVDVQSGILDALPGSPLAVGKGPRAVVVHPSGDWLYVLNGGSGEIARYRRDRLQGTLHEVPPRIAAGGQVDGMRLDPAGRYLYLTSTQGNPLSCLAVDAKNGGLTSQKGCAFSEGLSTLKFPVFSR